MRVGFSDDDNLYALGPGVAEKRSPSRSLSALASRRKILTTQGYGEQYLKVPTQARVGKTAASPCPFSRRC